LFAGLGIFAVGGGINGYLAIIKPRTMFSQERTVFNPQQSKKELKRTQDLLDIIQEKKVGQSTDSGYTRIGDRTRQGGRPRTRR
jgi:hypothetical protein